MVSFFTGIQAWCFDAYDSVHFDAYYRIDSTHQLSSSDVLRDDTKWNRIKDPENFNLGHNDFNVWLLLRLKNEKAGKNYLLTIENAHLDTLVLYKYGKSTTKIVSTG